MNNEQIQKLAEGIEQDFKSLRVYLDGLYYQGVHQIKDAGHLWIEFTDKFSAFEKRVKAILQDKRPESQQPITTVDEDNLWNEVGAILNNRAVSFTMYPKYINILKSKFLITRK